MHDEAVAPNERAQSDNEPTPVKLPLPISWRESLRAGWSSDGVTRSEFLLRELLLGVVVCMAQIPESIAFAYLARVRPPVALHSAWIVGLVCALGGGRPGMINGATGAFAAIIATFLEEPDVEGGNGAGIETLFPSVIVAGLLMLGVCYFRLDRFVALLPLPVMIGFCNGLAIVTLTQTPALTLTLTLTLTLSLSLTRPRCRHRPRAAPPVLRAQVRRLHFFRLFHGGRRGGTAQAEHWTLTLTLTLVNPNPSEP